MPVRGKRSIWPRKRPEPTGMFNSPQKNDPVSACCKDVQAYAKGSSTRTKPSGSGNKSLRHQKPNKGPRQ